ncbi:MAG TPA: hypothetical protein VK911_16770 [Vicinamibacterales bacterium]|nr:hypothetical protein [Vicinamibacterales bacterium]
MNAFRLQPIRRMPVLALSVLAMAASLAAAAWSPPSSFGSPAAGSDEPQAVARQGRYSLTGRIRPLLFWIGKDDVGEARIAWLAGQDGGRGYELLIGSDPEHAPRKINRWGYIAERGERGAVQVLGFMTEVDEETLEQAKAGVEGPQPGVRAFKIIQSSVLPNEATAMVTGAMLPDRLTYRDLEAVKRDLPLPAVAPQRVEVPPGAQPGFLFAMASLLHENVETYLRTGRPPANGQRSYIHGDKLYDVVTQSSRFVKRAAFKGREFPNVIDSEFRTRSRDGGGGSKYRIVYGTEGPWREVPVRIVYRPKWWFEAEMVLTDVHYDAAGRQP